jgi:hypothetical protein
LRNGGPGKREIADSRPNYRMKLTGAANQVSRGKRVLQAAPAAYPYRSTRREGRKIMSRKTRSCFGLVLLVAALSHLLWVSATRARAPLPPYAHARSYRFTARITENSGVTPFKVGDVISGSFTYDLKGKNSQPGLPGHAFYESTRNAITFQVGDLQFTGVGDVTCVVNSLDICEDFGIVAPDLKLPDGWQMDHKRYSQTYSFRLQNAPVRNVIARDATIPERLKLSDFVDTHEVRFDFFEGVSFPGGKVAGRATVYAKVDTLEPVR